MLRNIPEGRRSHLLRGESLKSSLEFVSLDTLRTLSEHSQNTRRTLSEQQQNTLRTIAEHSQNTLRIGLLTEAVNIEHSLKPQIYTLLLTTSSFLGLSFNKSSVPCTGDFN